METETEMTATDIYNYCGSSGAKWAEQLCQLHPDLAHKEDLLVGWFANAIEHSIALRCRDEH